MTNGRGATDDHPTDDRSDPDSTGEPGILHVDMDAFFVSVELIDHPELRGRPVIVGGEGNRGVVAAASYEARSFGVHSAMASTRARRLCPHAVFLAGRHDRYAEVSRDVMAVFGSFTPLVEPLSLDEAFLDVRGARRLHGSPTAIATAIRRRVLDEIDLTCSVGIAPSKFVAKLASEAAKPRPSVEGPRPGLGIKLVRASEVDAFLSPLPVSALWGVGPATLERLTRLGVITVGDLAELPVDAVTRSLGQSLGAHLHALANGIDDRVVEPDRRPKSVSHEETFAHDHHRRETLEREVVRLADAVGSRLRQHDLSGRTVTLKVRFSDFHIVTRSQTLPSPTDSTSVITREAKGLLAGVDPSGGVRLLGVGVSGLVEGGARQLALDEVDALGWDDATQAVDAIRSRFGADAIGPATLADEGRLRIRRQGDAPWGPSDRPVPGVGAEPAPTGRSGSRERSDQAAGADGAQGERSD
jgi:DNA polymerase IV